MNATGPVRATKCSIRRNPKPVSITFKAEIFFSSKRSSLFSFFLVFRSTRLAPHFARWPWKRAPCSTLTAPTARPQTGLEPVLPSSACTGCGTAVGSKPNNQWSCVQLKLSARLLLFSFCPKFLTLLWRWASFLVLYCKAFLQHFA